jgi:hypothetical protein
MVQQINFKTFENILPIIFFNLYWVFQKGMYSLIGGKLAKASSARKNSKIN